MLTLSLKDGNTVLATNFKILGMSWSEMSLGLLNREKKLHLLSYVGQFTVLVFIKLTKFAVALRFL